MKPTAMTPNQRATIETVARQVSIPEAERRAWVAGAEWCLAQHDAPEPQKPLPIAALVGGKEWEAPMPINAPVWQARKPDPSLVCPVCHGVGRVELAVPCSDPWRTCPHCQDTGKGPTNG